MKLQSVVGYAAGVATVLAVWLALSARVDSWQELRVDIGSILSGEVEKPGAGLGNGRKETEVGLGVETGAELATPTEATAPPTPLPVALPEVETGSAQTDDEGPATVAETVIADADATATDENTRASLASSAAVTPEPVRHYFWSPFSLRSRAEKFARQITKQSGVDCIFEKSGVGEYRVYFTYTDRAERDFKLSQISSMGIVVQ